MIGALARKYLNQHSQPAVDKGRIVSAEYTMMRSQGVNSLCIDQLVNQLVNQLVQLSSEPGAGAASALGLICEVQHPEARRIIVTLSLCNSGRDQGCHS